MENLQIRTIYSAQVNRYVYITTVAAPSDIRFSGCRIRGDDNVNANGKVMAVNDVDATVKIWNCILFEADVDGIQNIAGTTVMYNCIVYGIVGNGVHTDVAMTVKNVASFSNGDDFQDDSAAATIDYCASDDGDGTNAVAPSGANWANEYTNAAGGDFTLVAGGNCEGGGTDNPGAGLYSTDIDGDAYTSPWSIGVDAKTAAGGLSIPIAMYHYKEH